MVFNGAQLESKFVSVPPRLRNLTAGAVGIPSQALWAGAPHQPGRRARASRGSSHQE